MTRLAMRWRNSEQAYGGVAVAAHWITVVCVIFAWFIGTFLTDFARGAARDGALFVHMTLGLTIFACLVIRLIWRFIDPPPPAIASPRFDPWLGLAAKAGHFVLYALLIATPILGIVLQFARGQPLPLFGIIDIPSPWAFDRDFFRRIIGMHQLAANALGVVAILHAAVALVHQLGLRDGTLARMAPFARR
jgi:cytochrome b561